VEKLIMKTWVVLAAIGLIVLSFPVTPMQNQAKGRSLIGTFKWNASAGSVGFARTEPGKATIDVGLELADDKDEAAFSQIDVWILGSEGRTFGRTDRFPAAGRVPFGITTGAKTTALNMFVFRVPEAENPVGVVFRVGDRFEVFSTGRQ
jgi:hypothetical protein